jgi:hypothetical protein
MRYLEEIEIELANSGLDGTLQQDERAALEEFKRASAVEALRGFAHADPAREPHRAENPPLRSKWGAANGNFH